MMSTDLAIDKKLWLKTVDDLQVQNNNLKEELSVMLQQELSAASLNRLESFQTQLLDKDAAMALLRYDITEVLRDMCQGHKGLPGRLLRLGRDILSMEDDTMRMKSQLAVLQAEISRKAL